MRRTRSIAGSTALIVAAVFAGCTDQLVEPESPGVAVAEDVQFKVRGRTPDRTTGCTGCPEDGTYSDALDAVNVALEAEGANIRVFKAEYLTTGQHDAMGQVVFNAIEFQDLPLIVGVLTMIGLISLNAHIVLDVLYVALDSRLRYA